MEMSEAVLGTNFQKLDILTKDEIQDISEGVSSILNYIHRIENDKDFRFAPEITDTWMDVIHLLDIAVARVEAVRNGVCVQHSTLSSPINLVDCAICIQIDNLNSEVCTQRIVNDKEVICLISSDEDSCDTTNTTDNGNEGQDQGFEYNSQQQGRQEKRKHRKSDTPSRKRTDMNIWKDITEKCTSRLPDDIDGTVVYSVDFDKECRMASTKDRRPWKIWKSSSRKEFNGIRRKTSCSGGYICSNDSCDFFKYYKIKNQVLFSKKGECSICGENGSYVECNTEKIWEFDDNLGKVMVYHHGYHTCQLRPTKGVSSVREEIKKKFRSNPKTTPTQAADSVLVEELQETEICWEKIDDIANQIVDPRYIRNLKKSVMEDSKPHGESLEAVANLRKKIMVKDPYYIYRLNDGNMNGDLTYVFKMSRCQAELGIAMDTDSEGFLKNEYCFGDGTFERCPGYITLGLHVYVPLLRRIVKLATMEKAGKGEGEECWTIFWKHFNEVLRLVKGEPCQFNPRGFCFDEAGGAWCALNTVFGEESVNRAVSCEKHFTWSIDKFASSFRPKSAVAFSTAAMKLMTSITFREYNDSYNEIVNFIERKPDKRGFLFEFLNFWHRRRSHFSRAFKASDAPKMNMSETMHSSYKCSGSTNLSLLDAAYKDVIYAIKLERSLVQLKEGCTVMGEGPTTSKRKKRSYFEDLRKSAKLADDIIYGDKNDEAGPSNTPSDPKCKHRPENPKVSDLSSSSEDEFSANRVKLNDLKRSERKRSGKSKQFVNIEKASKNLVLSILNSSTGNKEIKFSLIDNVHQERVEVIIRRNPSCSCESFCAEKKRKQTCKHIVWLLLKHFNLPEHSELLPQISYTNAELEYLFSLHGSHDEVKEQSGKTKETSVMNTFLTEPERKSIFEGHNLHSRPQNWHADKITVRKKASCCTCKSTMPEGKMYVFVNGLYIPPRGNQFAVDRVFLFLC